MLLSDVIKALSVPHQRSVILSHFAYTFAYLDVIIFDQLINIWKERGIVFWNHLGWAVLQFVLKKVLGHYLVISHFGSSSDTCG